MIGGLRRNACIKWRSHARSGRTAGQTIVQPNAPAVPLSAYAIGASWSPLSSHVSYYSHSFRHEYVTGWPKEKHRPRFWAGPVIRPSIASTIRIVVHQLARVATDPNTCQSATDMATYATCASHAFLRNAATRRCLEELMQEARGNTRAPARFSARRGSPSRILHSFPFHTCCFLGSPSDGSCSPARVNYPPRQGCVLQIWLAAISAIWRQHALIVSPGNEARVQFKTGRHFEMRSVLRPSKDATIPFK